MASSPTSRLALLRPLALHGFSRGEYYDNLGIIDSFPGIFPCTAAERPDTWGIAHRGMFIFETDRNLLWRWTGASFVRHAPIGLLGAGTLTGDFTTAATAPTSALAVPVTVPETNDGSTTKRIKVSGTWHSLVNGTSTTLGVSEVSLLRGSTVLAKQRVRGRPTTATDPMDWGVGGSIIAFDAPAAGAHTYHLAINSIPSVGGTTELEATATTPAMLMVEEVGL